MVYLARKNGGVVAHANKAAMEALDGVKPEKTITDAEWAAGGNLARVIEGEIVVGKTEGEKAAEKAAAEKKAAIADLKQKLAESDYIVIKIAEGAAKSEDYAEQIAQRQAWRKQVEELEAEASARAA
jgi:hypothetical protein